MLKKYVVFTLLLSFSATLQAQFSYGLKAGLNVSRVLYKNYAKEGEFGFAPSFHVGMYASVDVSNKFTFSGDFLISDKGWKEGSAAHLLYASVPVLAQLRAVKKVSVGIGPSMGVLITHWGKDRELTKKIYNNRFDFGAVASVKYSITSSIALSLRFEQGLSNVIGKDASFFSYSYIQDGDPIIVNTNPRDAGFKVRHQTFQLSVCYGM